MFPKILCEQIEHFFRHYKELEKDKWVKLTGWVDRGSARKLIAESPGPAELRIALRSLAEADP